MQLSGSTSKHWIPPSADDYASSNCSILEHREQIHRVVVPNCDSEPNAGKGVVDDAGDGVELEVRLSWCEFGVWYEYR